jgi:WXG100 family type VII secretion target
MTTEFYAETENIAQASSLAKGCELEVDDIIKGLVRRTDSTLANWSGPASNAYRAAITKWQADADQILQALDGMSRSLARSQANYDETEAQHVTGLENFTYAI